MTYLLRLLLNRTYRIPFLYNRGRILSHSGTQYHHFRCDRKHLAPVGDSGTSTPTTPGDRYIAVFTCKICNKREAKSFSKRAYEHGVVYVKCSGCSNLHLISDQLGWFGEDKENIEEILSKQGDSVTKAELGEDISEEDLKLIASLKSKNNNS